MMVSAICRVRVVYTSSALQIVVFPSHWSHPAGGENEGGAQPFEFLLQRLDISRVPLALLRSVLRQVYTLITCKIKFVSAQSLAFVLFSR